MRRNHRFMQSCSSQPLDPLVPPFNHSQRSHHRPQPDKQPHPLNPQPSANNTSSDIPRRLRHTRTRRRPRGTRRPTTSRATANTASGPSSAAGGSHRPIADTSRPIRHRPVPNRSDYGGGRAVESVAAGSVQHAGPELAIGGVEVEGRGFCAGGGDGGVPVEGGGAGGGLSGGAGCEESEGGQGGGKLPCGGVHLGFVVGGRCDVDLELVYRGCG